MASTSEISIEPVEQPAEVTTTPGLAYVPSRNGASNEEPLPDMFIPEWQRQGMPDTEFNRKYPPDAWGEEMAPDARVWKVYRDRQDLSHNGMLAGWNKTLDVLLIFAGLFSAVVTAFLVESYKTLQPDYSQYIATFLYAAAASYNRTGGIFPAPDTIVPPDRFMETSTAQRWTNGLWFSSLVISLAVALLCILIKQWLDAYDSHVSAAALSPKHWARRHSLYYCGLKTWGVSGLISFLPLVLHLSLFLFLVGLIMFLRPLDGAISALLLVMVSCIGAFYVLSLVLPAWRIECPSYTPLLGHALLVASWAISGLLYVIRPPNWRVSLAIHRLLNALAIHQHARETRTIDRCEHEQDGFVLNTLIHLHSRANLDASSTAVAAIGAVTSTRTMDVICRKALRPGLQSKLSACDGTIPSTATGFGITSRARLHRAYWAVTIHAGPHWLPLTQHDRGLLSPLDIDGLLLEALEFRNYDAEIDIDHLIPPLQSLAPSGKKSSRLPLRSICLTFLEHLSSRHYENPSFLCCFLLVFCAGRFGSAERHELVRALRSVATVLTMHCSITLRSHESEDPYFICAVLDGLWVILTDCAQYHVDLQTAQIVAPEVVTCFKNQGGTRRQPQMPGLASFVRSPAFGQCVGPGNTVTDYWGIVQVLTINPEDYWTSIAILSKMWYACAQGPKNAADFFNHFMLLAPNYCYQDVVSGRNGGRYEGLDDWYEPALSAFLDSPNAIATWTRANAPNFDDDPDLNLALLAERISILLYRRQRLGRANEALIRGLFSGTFLLARFRDLVSHHPPSDGSGRNVEQLTRDIASHCLKLSPERISPILTQLEESWDADTELHARAVAFAQRIRDGSAPGGVMAGECAADCPCMIDGEHRARSWGDIGNNLVTRFRRARTEVVPAV